MKDQEGHTHTEGEIVCMGRRKEGGRWRTVPIQSRQTLAFGHIYNKTPKQVRVATQIFISATSTYLNRMKKMFQNQTSLTQQENERKVRWSVNSQTAKYIYIYMHMNLSIYPDG